MDYAFTYISSNGDSVEFGGNDIWLDDDPLRSAEIAYTESNRIIKGFHRELKKFTVKAAAQTGSAAEAVELCNRIVRLGRCDRESLTPGTIRCGDYSTSGYIVGLTFEPGSDLYGFSTNFKFDIAVEDPTWLREETFSYLKGTEVAAQSAEGEYDFPLDYPYDYMAPSYGQFQVDNRDAVPCDMRLTVYGPAMNPSIRIGDNVYQCNCSVADGSVLVIDTRKKQVYERLEYGDEVSRLDSRERGSVGGGSYIFEKLPNGLNVVSYNRAFGFDLTIIHEEVMPPFFIGGDGQ